MDTHYAPVGRNITKEDIPREIREAAIARTLCGTLDRCVAIGYVLSTPRERGVWTIRFQAYGVPALERLDDGSTFRRIAWAHECESGQ